MARFLTFQDVSFTYDGLGEDLFADLTLRMPTGWTGIVGANGSGKTTLLRLAAGELAPAAGEVHRPGPVIYCAQRTDDPPEAMAEFLAATDALARELAGRLDVRGDFRDRWTTLSHGQRKRAQIAVALWRQPAVLALDEPSNHIDAAARDLLLRRLAEFDGVGLLVSHDRQLLDGLCRTCLFVDGVLTALRPGNYTAASAQHEADLQRRRDLRDKASQTVRRLRQEMVHRRDTASREHTVRSKRGLSHKDHDAKEKIDRARVSDSKAGSTLRQLAGRLDQATGKLAAMVVKNESESGIFLGDCRSRRNFLFRLPAGRIRFDGGTAAASAGGEGTEGPDAEVGAGVLEFPALAMGPSDHVAVTGPNGTGKSTLIRHLVEHLSLPAERVLIMPQEIHARDAAETLRKARQLRPDRLGWVMNIISRLGSSPDRVLQTEQPSPGEVRKLLLAMGIQRESHLLILDEPTNHLDLPSIQCMEEALADCPCGLLMVSHDLVFLRKLTTIRWDIQPAETAPGRFRLTVDDDWTR
jgi:macrolide transport system ATP-binding/permease protein